MQLHYKRSTLAVFFALIFAALSGAAALAASFNYLPLYYWLVAIPAAVIAALSLPRWMRHSAGALRISEPFATLREDGLQIKGCLIPWVKIQRAEYWMAGEIYIVIDELTVENIDVPPLASMCPELHKKMVSSVPAPSREDHFAPDAIRLICWGLDKTPRDIVDLINTSKEISRRAQRN